MAIATKTTLRNQVIYSIYVRNYSEEGSFAAVEKDLDRIQKLGVDIIWFLPIYPIGREKRKGILGSPYAISNYREINPELGTMEDFKQLANAIHQKGMKCIIDIVYNHTSPDSWLAEHYPQYFYKTPDGNMGNRVGDWSDIVDLDYSNRELWEYQIETLKMWAEIVDGFRCDVAPLVPLAFWQKARDEVENVRPGCIWLSESVEPAFVLGLRSEGISVLSDSEIFRVFDICYDYDTYGLFRSYLRGESKLSKYVEYVNMQEYIFPENYIKMRYLENHDQDRAKAIIDGQSALLNWTAFIYFQKGTTLIYAGQENQNRNRPDLFHKDVIQLDNNEDISDLLASLYEIKQLPLLADSSYHLEAVDELGVIVGEHKGIHTSDRLIGIFSFEEKQGNVPVPLADGEYPNMISGQNIRVESGEMDIAACPVVVKTA